MSHYNTEGKSDLITHNNQFTTNSQEESNFNIIINKINYNNNEYS